MFALSSGLAFTTHRGGSGVPGGGCRGRCGAAWAPPTRGWALVPGVDGGDWKARSCGRLRPGSSGGSGSLRSGEGPPSPECCAAAPPAVRSAATEAPPLVGWRLCSRGGLPVGSVVFPAGPRTVRLVRGPGRGVPPLVHREREGLFPVHRARWPLRFAALGVSLSRPVTSCRCLFRWPGGAPPGPGAWSVPPARGSPRPAAAARGSGRRCLGRARRTLHRPGRLRHATRHQVTDSVKGARALMC
jgi:hypothetical protein